MKKAKKIKKVKRKQPLLPRTRKVIVSFNEKEYNAICNYLSKYNIPNRSRWMRETVMTAIFQRLSDDYPTLFSEEEMMG